LNQKKESGSDKSDKERLIEKTVVGAFRDWLKNQIPTEIRTTIVEVGSKAESKIGDALLRNKEKIYLLEFKSSDETIKEEWSNGRKNSNLKLRSEITRIGELDQSSAPEDHPIIFKSHLCHHFLFWNPTSSGDSVNYGHLVVEPYLTATNRLGGFSTRKSKEKDKLESGLDKGLGMVKKYYPAFLTEPDEMHEYDHSEAQCIQKLSRFTADQIIQDVAVIGVDSSEQFYRECGLQLKDFQEYVNFLCGGESQTIHALLISKYGTLCEVIHSTSELKKIFDSIDNDATPPPPAPEPQGEKTKAKKYNI